MGKQEQQHKQQIKQQEQQQMKEKQKQDDDADDDDEKVADNIKNSSSDDSDSDSDSSDSEGDENSSGSDTMEVDDDADDDDDDDDDSEEEEEEEPVVDDSVGKKCCLFLRNLPFDATRHDLFQLLHKFGHIKGIYLVKDRETGMLKGTAFVTYSKPQAVENAMEHASAGSFVSQRQSVGISEKSNDDENQMRGSLLLKGRKILVDLAVDKETAATFDSKEYKIPHADRRNMYLQAEARVEGSSIDPKDDNTDTWDDLPQQDQRKRQTALKDKTAKLQSPIFFINPNRLSFRNMGKHVDEAGLQKLLELAVKRGLEKRLVGAQDQIAHWRALGEMSTRDILSKVQDIEGKGHDVIPGWSYGVDVGVGVGVGVDNDEGKDDGKGESDGKITRRNIIDYIPSVFIDRDYGPSGKKKDAPSRGFGFAEFTHHTHALACLRELNNNHAYSRDYAAGGRTADALKKRPQRKNGKKNGGGGVGGGGADYRDEDGRVHVPRLVVDFVVENRVKANKQKERRLKQQLNQSKMVLNNLDNKKAMNEESKTKKRGRGAVQREKKKLKRESGEEEAERQKKLQGKAMYEAKKELRKERAEQKKIKMEEMKRKSVKPPKKKKSQLKKVEDDEEFEDILRSYTSKLESAREENTEKTNPRAVVEEKRWFE